MHPQVQNNDLRWDGWNDMATYLMGQYVLSPKRLGGHPVYKQAETVNKENLFIFRDSFYWRFSHVFGTGVILAIATTTTKIRDCLQKNGNLGMRISL